MFGCSRMMLLAEIVEKILQFIVFAVPLGLLILIVMEDTNLEFATAYGVLILVLHVGLEYLSEVKNG